MNKNINTQTLGLVAAFLLLVATAGGFFWLWNSSQPGEVSDVSVDQKYQKIDISTIKSDAENLTRNKENQGNLPLVAPAADQIGRDNPFAGV